MYSNQHQIYDDQVQISRGGSIGNIGIDQLSSRMGGVQIVGHHQHHQQHHNTNSGHQWARKYPVKKEPKEPILRTPLSLLNEVCNKSKINPEYEVKEDGPVHARIFECQVNVILSSMSWKATGIGKTKKEAKQDAAMKLLKTMDEKIEQYLLPIPTRKDSPSPTIECDPEVPGNPVSELNELCLKVKKVPPTYEEEEVIGKPHERIYKIKCVFPDKIEVGTGRTKKSAKRAAAFAMMVNVAKSLKDEEKKQEEEKIIEETGEGKILKTLDYLTNPKGKKKERNSNKRKNSPNSQKVEKPTLEHVLKQYKEFVGPKIETIQDRKVNDAEALTLLQEICNEKNLYFDVADLQSSQVGSHSAVVSFGTEHLTIFHAMGKDQTLARNKAASHAISFLRALTAN